MVLHLFMFNSLYAGEIYLAHDILLQQDVIMKLKPMEGEHHTLEHEFHVYTMIMGGPGIPCAHWFDTEAGFYMMAIDHLGQLLKDLFACCQF
jgi:hypothetical protein